jgi:hypothetical protein
MSESAVRGVIKTTIQALDNEGQVHDYERWANDWDAYLALYKTTIGGADYIRGWTITCEAMPTTLHQTNGVKIREYRHRVRMYWGLDDSAASEKAAFAKCEELCNALDDSALHGDGYYLADPASLEIFENRVFGSVLCHYAEIQQSTYEVVS